MRNINMCRKIDPYTELEFNQGVIQEVEQLANYIARFLENSNIFDDLNNYEKVKIEFFLIILCNYNLLNVDIELFKQMLDKPYNFPCFDDTSQSIKDKPLPELTTLKKVIDEFVNSQHY